MTYKTTIFDCSTGKSKTIDMTSSEAKQYEKDIEEMNSPLAQLERLDSIVSRQEERAYEANNSYYLSSEKLDAIERKKELRLLLK